ncbi:MAG: hypothetical protein ACFFGZ_20075, partial [Candidatus Thorarchaeota archaeon]
MVDESPNIGIFLCGCSGKISERIDLNYLAEKAEKLPNVSFVSIHSCFCSEEGQGIIKEALCSEDVNRVLVAACS